MASRWARNRCLSSIGRSLTRFDNAINFPPVDQARNVSSFRQISQSRGSCSRYSPPLSHTILMESIGKNKYSTKLEAFSNLGIMPDRIRSRYFRRRRKSRSPLQGKYISPQSAPVRVRSIHAAQTLNLISVLSKVFGSGSSNPTVNHVFGKNSLIVQLRPAANDETDEVTPKTPQFVAVYRFGSVVFLNVSSKNISIILQAIKRHG